MDHIHQYRSGTAPQYDVAKKTVLDDNCKRVLYIAGRRDGYVTEQRLKGMKRLVKDLDLTMMVDRRFQ